MSAAVAGFDVHGLRVALTGEASLAAAAEERLAWFPRVDAVDTDASVHFTATPPEGADGGVPGGRVVYESRFGDIRYVPEHEELRLVGDGLGLLCRAAFGEATIWVDTRRPDASWLASRPLFSLVLFELLRARDLFVVHAAAAAVGPAGLVVVGDSGRGKSTLALALARRGLPLLGDDLLFLSEDAGGSLVLHGFPEPVDVTADSAPLFPELAELRRDPPPGWPKHRIPVDAFGAPPAATATPGAVVFLDERGDGPSRLTTLGEAEALLRLAPNVLLTDPERSQRHVDLLGRLLATSDRRLLRAGNDPDEAAVAATALLGSRDGHSGPG